MKLILKRLVRQEVDFELARTNDNSLSLFGAIENDGIVSKRHIVGIQDGYLRINSKMAEELGLELKIS